MSLIVSLTNEPDNETPEAHAIWVVEPRDWPGKLYPERLLEVDEGDHLRIDEQGLE